MLIILILYSYCKHIHILSSSSVNLFELKYYDIYNNDSNIDTTISGAYKCHVFCKFSYDLITTKDCQQ